MLQGWKIHEQQTCERQSNTFRNSHYINCKSNVISYQTVIVASSLCSKAINFVHGHCDHCSYMLFRFYIPFLAATGYSQYFHSRIFRPPSRSVYDRTMFLLLFLLCLYIVVFLRTQQEHVIQYLMKKHKQHTIRSSVVASCQHH